ncbi:MAG: tetratricopeptide repeat protein [Armatimonadota bacterium]
MRHRTITLAALILGLLTLALSVQAVELKQIKEGSITVSYPTGMDVQARRILSKVKESIQPSLDIQEQTVKLLADPGVIAGDIAGLLGCEDKKDEALSRLKAYKTKSQALVACFSNIRLIKKSEAVAMGGVDAGVMQIRYDDKTDEFNMVLSLDNIDPEKIKLSYFPVFVNADGTIRAENKLTDMAMDFMGSSKAMLIAPVHDTVGYVMAEELDLYQPFARWFNEGVSGWVARHVVVKTDSRLAGLANDLLDISPGSKQLRDKIDLLSWPQRAFQNLKSPSFNPELEVAQTQYSIRILSDLLDKNGTQILPAIMKEVNFNPNADTDTVCSAIKKVTGKDFKSILLGYVPADIRDGIKSNDAPKLTKRAEELVGEKKLVDAADRLRKALEMDPQDINARLNLAWIERETGDSFDSEFQTFITARLLTKGNYSFHLYGDSIEGNYVLARLSILMGNIEYAKKLLQPVLLANPNHADAKRAMEQIDKLNSAMHGGTSNP